jgi:hypothetical protein
VKASTEASSIAHHYSKIVARSPRAFLRHAELVADADEDHGLKLPVDALGGSEAHVTEPRELLLNSARKVVGLQNSSRPFVLVMQAS